MDARPANNKVIEVFDRRRAAEDQREDDGDIIADHKKHAGVDGDPEPSHRRKCEVEEEEREFGGGKKRTVQNTGDANQLNTVSRDQSKDKGNLH